MNDNFWWGFWIWIFVVCFGIFFSAILIDSGGRHADRGEHYQGLPAKVHQLSPRTYISFEQGPSASDICGYASVPNIRSQATLYKLEGKPVFIECRTNQIWNVKKPLSPDLGDGFAETAMSPVAWGIIGGSLILFLLPGTMQELGYLRQRKHRRNQFKLSFPKKKEALENAWARDEIDDLTYENKLQKLLEEEHK